MVFRVFEKIRGEVMLKIGKDPRFRVSSSCGKFLGARTMIEVVL